MNRKAQFEAARKTIYWMMAGVVITIVVIAFAMIMASYQSKLMEVPPRLRAELISLRFLNTPECFAYEDEISGRIFPGVIDLSRFNEETLGECYKSGSIKNFNFQLVLDDKMPGGRASGTTKVALETDEWFNRVDYTLFKEVLVKKGDELKSATLKIYVQEKI